MPSIITTQQLLDLRHQKNLVLLDARSGPDAFAQYQVGHLQGALFIDLEKDMANKKKDLSKGGRHPLPPLQRFADLLGRLGITPSSHVVVYDDKNGANAAARCWWMLRAVGHQSVQVLEKGFAAALAADYPIESGTRTAITCPVYKVRQWKLPMVEIKTVEAVAKNPNYLVIDVRESMRYRGEKEPIDLIAGHIPGAKNIPYTENLNEDGSFKSPKKLRQYYQAAIGKRKNNHVIVHCGSGVTACHTLLAMDHAGLAIPKLYVGSWSEWSRTERTIAKEI
jgi:thiosulfate/3-mercaptopyruvate sulfurtransferase